MISTSKTLLKMKKTTKLSLVLFSLLLLSSCGPKGSVEDVAADLKMSELEKISIMPISHASTALKWEDKIIYSDPVGGAVLYQQVPVPDVVFVTDIHQDHFDAETLTSILKDQTTLIVPQAVYDELPEGINSEVVILKNGESVIRHGFKFVAVPMYNLPESADSFHTKGRGNGYIIEKNKARVYFAGDTSGTPEMKALKDIDAAFIPMNLPFTMTVEQAAEAVLVFKPKIVYPYHYRGNEGLSDVAKFKEIVEGADKGVEVVQFDWYPESSQ